MPHAGLEAGDMMGNFTKARSGRDLSLPTTLHPFSLDPLRLHFPASFQEQSGSEPGYTDFTGDRSFLLQFVGKANFLFNSQYIS